MSTAADREEVDSAAIQSSMKSDLDIIESYLILNKQSTSNAQELTPRPVDENQVESLREQCEELLVRSHALQQENESLIRELTTLRSQRSNHPSAHDDSRGASHDVTPAPNSFGAFLDKLLPVADSKRATAWVHQAQSTQPELAATIEVGDAKMIIVLTPAKRNVVLRRTSGGATRTPPVQSLIHRPVPALQTLALAPTSKTLALAPTSKTIATRSQTPPAGRPTRPTPVRAVSPGVSIPATTIKSKQPPTTTSTAVRRPVGSSGPSQTVPAARNSSPPKRGSSPAISRPGHAATTVSSSTGTNTLQQCGVLLRKSTPSTRVSTAPVVRKSAVPLPKREALSSPDRAPPARHSTDLNEAPKDTPVIADHPMPAAADEIQQTVVYETPSDSAN